MLMFIALQVKPQKYVITKSKGKFFVQSTSLDNCLPKFFPSLFPLILLSKYTSLHALHRPI